MPETQSILERDFDEFVSVFPTEIHGELRLHKDTLIEVIADYGRQFEVRTSKGSVLIGPVVAHDTLRYIVGRLGSFSPSERACVDGTLHRFSRIVNCDGEVIGLTCRRGIPYIGSIDLIKDYVETCKSILLIGLPAAGKTSRVRDIARYCSVDLKKRVIVVDADNEIAGGGDLPHPSVGKARRMMVPRNRTQADMMIMAIENHMPEILIVDEISSKEDVEALLSASKRGVVVIATAHGRSLHEAIENPILNKVLGNIKSVTLGDDEAEKRGTQKTVLERETDPVFDIVVELHGFDEVGIYHDIGEAVDTILRGGTCAPEERRMINGTPQLVCRGRRSLPTTTEPKKYTRK